ncbi:craniofacial development protein 2-like [Sipha flava]|uniref:Craniofacial development protein 2-like n=1 Tax=Sipha flava TaxID=143950 RepID=A0A8B8GF33_9HEMI|nr:craniofacial development protein 2-like [Sipha flava]
MEFKIATGNVMSLFRTGACKNLMEVLDVYKIKVAGIQEVRWAGKGQLKVGKNIIYFSGMEERHQFGCGFAVHETKELHIKEFNPISERLAVLRIDTKPINIALICTYAPTKAADEDIKDTIYEDLIQAYDKLPGNAIKIVLGDFNAKCGREIQFSHTLGKESLHDISNGNGLRLISFATGKDMMISSTMFPHKKIYKGTWKSPDGITINQIDHVLIQKRFRSCIRDNIEEEDIEEEWCKISKAIKKVAEQIIGRLKNGKKKWYNEKCREAIEKRRMAQDNYVKYNDANTKIIYEIERKNCKRIIQREKRNFLNSILQEAEKDRSQSSIRNFFRTIRHYNSFNPSLKAIKNRDREIIMKPELKAIRWEEYFNTLMDSTAIAVILKFDVRISLLL